MPTPLYDVLKEYASSSPGRWHMPGHKGNCLTAPELMGVAPLDVTELPSTGNLYTAGPPFEEAQRLWAEEFGFEYCQFLTGGSTMGIHTGLSLCARPGSRILLDRNCHRAAFHALALLDLEPVYLERPWLREDSLIGPVSPEDVENSLERHPDIKTVCITSPTYAGVLSNIWAISRIVHARGGKLFVDGAHGAHLPFLGLDPFSGADAVVASAHKTLPALGQAALLFTRGMEPEQVRRMASVYGTSSPSYPIMASMDLARDYMTGEEGFHAYRRAALQVAELRRRFPSLEPRAVPGPCPPGPPGAGRPRLCPRPGGEGNFSRNGGRRPCGPDLHRPGYGGKLLPPDRIAGEAPSLDGPLSPSPPSPSAPAGNFPARRPVCPQPGQGAGELRGGDCRRSDRPLPSRRARGGPGGADWKKRAGLFAKNRV